MDHVLQKTMSTWYLWVPALAVIALAATWGAAIADPVAVAVGAVLVGSVLAAVHHAEVIAARVGEPFGSIILAVSVTVLEVGLIVMTMTGGKPQPTLARDTVFAAVMITTNLIVGLSLFVSAGRAGFASFRPTSTGSMLATVAAIATLTMVVPNFTSTPTPTFTPQQLTFAAVASLGLYVLFIATQGKTHREYFLPVDDDGRVLSDDHHAAPSPAGTVLSGVGLIVSLVAVVGLGKVVTVPLERGITGIGLPANFVGVLIALLILAPETLAAVRAARRGRVQVSMNLAYGSAIASIGLTIPALAALSPILPDPLVLGLGPLHMVLLALTLLVSVLTVLPGRATRLLAGIHLVLVLAYVFLAAVP